MGVYGNVAIISLSTYRQINTTKCMNGYVPKRPKQKKKKVAHGAHSGLLFGSAEGR